jgi:hypothetical protein
MVMGQFHHKTPETIIRNKQIAAIANRSPGQGLTSYEFKSYHNIGQTTWHDHYITWPTYAKGSVVSQWLIKKHPTTYSAAQDFQGFPIHISVPPSYNMLTMCFAATDLKISVLGHPLVVCWVYLPVTDHAEP